MHEGYRRVSKFGLVPTPDVRKATMADIDTLAGVVARAFGDDPIWTYLFPGRNALARRIAFTAYELRHVYMGNDEVWTTTDGIKGAAIWAPPRKWRQPLTDTIRSVPSMVRLLGRQLPKAARLQTAIEAAHPPGEHYYLSILGTDPVAQGQGVASACMQPVLDRCDREGLGAYLESSKEKNVPFYNRHGFEVTRELALPAGAPPIWLMWREPRG